MPKVAAITMVYNEPDFLPVWLRYYTTQLGSENCFVIDHGSDDGSTDSLDGAVMILRLDRSPHNDGERAVFVSKFAESLLSRYDFVLYSDVDEIVFSDPRIHTSLRKYCEGVTAPVVTAYGFELLFIRSCEKAADLSRPILEQRQWVRFASAMCKPVLISKPVSWAPGFHSVAEPVAFDGLFLFHLRWSDLAISLRRLSRSRVQLWADPDAGRWQRVSDSEYEQMLDGLATIPRNEGCSFFSFDPLLRDAACHVTASQVGREDDTYKISLEIFADEAWRVPKAFSKLF